MIADDPQALQLYVDGNCYSNPGGAGAYACVARFPEALNRPDEQVFEESFLETTNQRMELSACIRAFEYAAEHAGELGVGRVIIFTDSQYVYDCHRLAAAWRGGGWKNRDGRPIENVDLWRRFLAVRQKIRLRVDIQWRKGKTTPILKQVDRAAKAAGKNPRRRDFGFRGGKIARSMAPAGSASMYPADGGEATIRVYRTELIGKTANKISFTLLDESTGIYARKFFAYASPPIAGELHRQHCYRVRFNSNPRHPQIEELTGETPA
ncbi:MAG: RNase H family protein [Acidobacteriota bacterium]